MGCGFGLRCGEGRGCTGCTSRGKQPVLQCRQHLRTATPRNAPALAPYVLPMLPGGLLSIMPLRAPMPDSTMPEAMPAAAKAGATHGDSGEVGADGAGERRATAARRRGWADHRVLSGNRVVPHERGHRTRRTRQTPHAPLAKTTMSGLTPSCSIAHMRPVRPTPCGVEAEARGDRHHKKRRVRA